MNNLASGVDTYTHDGAEVSGPPYGTAGEASCNSSRAFDLRVFTTNIFQGQEEEGSNSKDLFLMFIVQNLCNTSIIAMKKMKKCVRKSFHIDVYTQTLISL